MKATGRNFPGKTRAQIALELGLSPRLVESIEAGAIYKLKHRRRTAVALRTMRELAIQARTLRDSRIGNQPFSDIDAEDPLTEECGGG